MALVETKGLHFQYPTARGRGEPEWTLKDLNLSIESKSSVGLVGESGSGTSTLVRILCGLLTHQKGDVSFDGRDIKDWLAKDPRTLRSRNQIIFQSPRRSFDPRMSIGRSLSQPVRAIEKRKPSVDEMTGWLELVGLTGEVLPRNPHQLSGGQLQRIGVARALSVSPEVLYADEPTSALDVSVQAQVLNLLMRIRADLGLTLVMVSHDLAVISRVCEQVIVMKDGRIVDSGPMPEVFSNPSDPYTAALIASARSVGLEA